jgi:hypothetical protein
MPSGTPKGARILRPSSPGYSYATYDGSGALTDWQVQVVASSRYGAGGDCALSVVTIYDTAGAVDSDWEWLTLDDTGVCRADGDNILGATGDPFTDTLYIWGMYEHYRGDRDGDGIPAEAEDEHHGGACTYDLTTDTVTKLIDPATHRYNIAEIAPHPTTAGLLAAAPQLDASAWFECMELNYAGTASVGCPDVPEPMIEYDVDPWTSVHADLTPSLEGTAIAWGEEETKLFYGTEGAGAWRTNATW